VSQSVGNLGLQSGKEPWMEPLHAFIQQNVSSLKCYLDVLVDIDTEKG
jgi:hypothetical protein